MGSWGSMPSFRGLIRWLIGRRDWFRSSRLSRCLRWLNRWLLLVLPFGLTVCHVEVVQEQVCVVPLPMPVEGQLVSPCSLSAAVLNPPPQMLEHDLSAFLRDMNDGLHACEREAVQLGAS